MQSNNQIGLEALFENDQFNKGIAQYNDDTSKATANTESASSSMSSAWEGMAAVGQIVFNGIMIGIAAMTAELYLAVNAALETEQVMARMEFIVGNVGERTQVTADDVRAMADALSQVVPIDDEVITSAITMGLTFDGVTKDNIMPLIAAAADLSTWTGKDLPSSMKTLSLAISDPEKAMRLFRDANITLSDSEKEVLQGFKDTGDTAGATQFILEQLTKKGIIGLAEAMGDTAQGKLTIMQTALGNLQEALGGGLLTALSGVFDTITGFANSPEAISFFTDIGNAIGDFAEQALTHLPEVIDSVQSVFDWLSANRPVIVGILAAIGVALVAFGYTSAAAGAAAIAGLWPVILAMAAIGLAVGFLYKAWSENWGGIQDKVADVWTRVKPTFDLLSKWMQTNLPKAVKALSDVWTKLLLPSIKTVFGWWVDNIFPIYAETFVWMAENLPKAIKTLSDFWSKTLLPAMIKIGDFIEGTLFPIFNILVDWLERYIANGLKNLSTLWQNVLLPAITAVYNFINGVLIPGFNSLVSLIQGVLTAALNALTAIWTGVLLPAITAVWSFIQGSIIPLFNAVAGVINAVLNVALRALAGLWQNVLLPAIQQVWGFIQGSIIPIFQSVASVANGVLSAALGSLTAIWRGTLLPALQTVWNFISSNIIPIFSSIAATISGAVMGALNNMASFLNGVFQSALSGIRSAIQYIVDKLNALKDALNNLKLPSWLTPGSPTPLELGLVGINDQLAKLAGSVLPKVRMQMEVLSAVRDVPSSANSSGGSSNISNTSEKTSNYLYGPQFNIPSPSGFIETLQGL